MASSWSSSLKIEIIGTGEQAGTWGTTTNDNFRYALEQAIVGSTNVTFSGSDVDLTLTDSNASQTARFLRLNLTGSSGGARNLYLSTGANVQKTYIINNGLADTVTVQNKISTPSGTSIAIPAGKTMWVYNTGTNIVDVTNHLTSLTLGTALPIASGGTGGTTNSAARTNLGATTVGSNLFTLSNPAAITFLRVNADNSVSTLDAATFRTAIGAGAGSVTSVGGTGTVNGLTLTGTVTSSGNLTLGGTLSNVNLASAVTGTLPVSNGGTGQTSLTANNVILGNGTSAVGFVAPGANGNVLTSNGTTWTSATPSGAVSSFSAGTTGFTPNSATTGAVTLGGTLGVANGGTGQTSYTNGQLLIGNTTGNTLNKATLTAGTGISITNGAGSITIAQSIFGTNAQVFTYQVSQPQTFTIPSGVTKLKVTVIGGGGGGGGTSGNGGTGGTSTVASGTQSITSISATGGAGGQNQSAGGLGGVGSNGDLNIGGQGGSRGQIFSSAAYGGTGGSSILGGGGSSDNPGRAYGGGGGGWVTVNPCFYVSGSGGGGGGGAAIKWLTVTGGTLSVTVGDGGTASPGVSNAGAAGVVIFEW